MNSSIYRFTLDLHSTQSQISLPVTKGDTARVFLISLSDGGLPYTIADGCLAAMSIRRPTETTLEAFCVIENNTTIKYDFSQDEITVNTAVVAGVHDCDVTLYDSEGREIASPRFTMVVSDRVANKDDLEISDEDQNIIQAMIGAEASRKTAEEGRVNAEAERKANEKTRNEKVDEALAKIYDIGVVTKIAEVTLFASKWEGDDAPFSQVVNIEGVTVRTKVDLLPDVELLTIFHDKDIAFVTENEDGIVTVYAIGDKPTRDYTMQAALKEVEA